MRLARPRPPASRSRKPVSCLFLPGATADLGCPCCSRELITPSPDGKTAGAGPPPRPSCAKLRCSPIGTLAGAAIAAMRIKPAPAEAGPVPMIAALAQAVAARALDRIDGVDDSTHPLPEGFGLRRHQRRGECNPEYDRSGHDELAHDFLPSLLQQQSNDIPDGCRGKYRERVTSMAGMP